MANSAVKKSSQLCFFKAYCLYSQSVHQTDGDQVWYGVVSLPREGYKEVNSDHEDY